MGSEETLCVITTAHPWEVSCGALLLQYKAIKSLGITTVDSKCLTLVDVAYFALISCSTLHLICIPLNSMEILIK